MTARRRSVLLLLPVLAVAACGGGGSSTSGSVPANPNLTVIAEDIHFDQKTYTVPAGEVRVAYPNKGAQTHTLVVQSPTGDKIDPKLSVAPGKETGGVYQLQPGVYTIYCDITGHREAGMVATLTVG
jgi:plastocyanin